MQCLVCASSVYSKVNRQKSEKNYPASTKCFDNISHWVELSQVFINLFSFNVLETNKEEWLEWCNFFLPIYISKIWRSTEDIYTRYNTRDHKSYLIFIPLFLTNTSFISPENT